MALDSGYFEVSNPVKTNADRIQSMSDDELATHLHDIGWDCHLCAEHGRLDNEPLLRGKSAMRNAWSIVWNGSISRRR